MNFYGNSFVVFELLFSDEFLCYALLCLNFFSDGVTVIVVPISQWPGQQSVFNTKSRIDSGAVYSILPAQETLFRFLFTLLG